ncbi:hypothetical protein CsSME_00025737 [Camellia sinensis var. sinensis]
MDQESLLKNVIAKSILNIQKQMINTTRYCLQLILLKR